MDQRYDDLKAKCERLSRLMAERGSVTDTFAWELCAESAARELRHAINRLVDMERAE
jgi:hypothetical protein